MTVAPPLGLEVIALSTVPYLLSHRLRLDTMDLHHQAEALVDLPKALHDRSSYAEILARFYQLYVPLEQALTRHQGWHEVGVDLQQCSHVQRLANDLSALGKAPPRGPAPGFPDLTSFAHALGAFYVQEGSTLGGQIALRHLEKVGVGIPVEARCFFTGHGPKTRTNWQSFAAALDAFGMRHPQRQGDVLKGASSTFEAIIRWFGHGHGIQPFC